MADVVFLGPQRLQPSVDQILEKLGVQGPVCAVTAGWQEREGEVEELQRHLDRQVFDLKLYSRADRLFAHNPLLRKAHSRRQAMLRDQQRAYRLRLYHALEALRSLEQLPNSSSARSSQIRAAMTALRQLDRHHLRRIEQIHSRFPETSIPERGTREEVLALLSSCRAVLIAGGHIAVLLNRLRLFGLHRQLQDKTVIAWSAGAMALCDRVVLFHDRPPQGAGDAEVFEKGLGIVKGVIALPQAGQRLVLDDRQRISRLARRMSPAHCLTLDPGSFLHFRSDRLVECRQSSRLMPRGSLMHPKAENVRHEQALA